VRTRNLLPKLVRRRTLLIAASARKVQV